EAGQRRPSPRDVDRRSPDADTLPFLVRPRPHAFPLRRLETVVGDARDDGDVVAPTREIARQFRDREAGSCRIGMEIDVQDPNLQAGSPWTRDVRSAHESKRPAVKECLVALGATMRRHYIDVSIAERNNE